MFAQTKLAAVLLEKTERLCLVRWAQGRGHVQIDLPATLTGCESVCWGVGEGGLVVEVFALWTSNKMKGWDLRSTGSLDC